MDYVLTTFQALSLQQSVLVCLVFAWSGFVRTGLGFGGAALALPFLLLIKGDPIFWLPIVGFHLLFFSSITVYNRLSNIDWHYLSRSMWILIIPKVAGVLGLLTLPSSVLVVFLYTCTLFIAATFIFNLKLESQSPWLDRLFLAGGGYLSGTALQGAPLIAPVYAKNVGKHQYRDTMFVLWIVLVLIKMSAFIAFDQPLNWQFALMLGPFVAVGHVFGLKAHDYLISGEDSSFNRTLGIGLAAVSFVGLFSVIK